MEHQKRENARQVKEEERQLLLKLLKQGDTKDDYRLIRFGRGPDGDRKAELHYRLQCDLPTDNLVQEIWPNLNRTKSQ